MALEKRDFPPESGNVDTYVINTTVWLSYMCEQQKYIIRFSTLLCLLSSSSCLPPLLSSSHLSLHSPPISVLASLVSSCPAHVTLPLSSVVFHRPSFLRVQPTVICSSPVSLSSSTALPSLPLTPPFFACLLSLLLLFFRPSCFRTLAACVVVVRSEPRFPFRTGMLV